MWNNLKWNLRLLLISDGQMEVSCLRVEGVEDLQPSIIPLLVARQTCWWVLSYIQNLTPFTSSFSVDVIGENLLLYKQKECLSSLSIKLECRCGKRTDTVLLSWRWVTGSQMREF